MSYLQALEMEAEPKVNQPHAWPCPHDLFDKVWELTAPTVADCDSQGHLRSKFLKQCHVHFMKVTPTMIEHWKNNIINCCIGENNSLTLTQL